MIYIQAVISAIVAVLVIVLILKSKLAHSVQDIPNERALPVVPSSHMGCMYGLLMLVLDMRWKAFKRICTKIP